MNSAVSSAALAIRVRPGSPNHHLWNNNGTWWCHYTVHLPDFTKRRVRVSTGTSDLRQARRQRNRMIALAATARITQHVTQSVSVAYTDQPRRAARMVQAFSQFAA